MTVPGQLSEAHKVRTSLIIFIFSNYMYFSYFLCQIGHGMLLKKYQDRTSSFLAICLRKIQSIFQLQGMLFSVRLLSNRGKFKILPIRYNDNL